MKRKLLSILLTFCLAFSLLPTAALADGEDTPAPAEVPAAAGIVLPEAADGVITLDNGAYVMSGDTTATIKVPNGKNATLDLNGKTLTNKTGEHTIIVENGATLTITGNGIVDNVSHRKAAVYNEGTVTLAGGTFKRSVEKGTYSPYSDNGNSWYTIANYGTMEINTGVTVENAGGYSSMIRNGSDRVTANCYLTIKGGNFAGGINTVKNDRFGVLTINGGNFSNTAQYVIMNWNKAEITAGTFQTLDTASAVLFTSAYDSDANTVGNLTISGGEFKRASDTQEMIVDHYDESNKGNAVVTGGKFDADISKYIPTDYVQSADGTVEKLGETNAVAKVGGTYYKTLAEAIAAVSDDATITLLKDVTGTSTLSVNKTVTIDLNGHKITGGDTRAIHVTGGTLTLTGTGVVTSKKTKSFDGDSSVIRVGDNSGENRPAGLVVGENVTIKAPDSYGITVFGSKTTETVTIKGKVLADHAAAIGGNGSAGFGGTKIVIEPSAEVVSTGYTGIYHPQTGTLTINGGIIKGLSAIESKSGETIIAVNGDPTITATGSISHNENNNGTSTSGYAIAVVNNKNYAGSANVTINSGKYTGLIAVVDDQEDSEKNGTITITGGLFSSDPSAYVADGHYVDASNNGDYPYTVKVGTKPAGALIVVKDKTDAAVNEGIKTEDKKAIHDVIGDANIDGVAEAVTPAKKADIVMKSGVTLTGSEKVEIEIAVKVEAKDADLVNGKLTFEVTPEATVKVDGTEQSKKVPVTNDMLNGKPITVKLPLPTVNGSRFTPKQILHKFTGGGYEYFINESVGGMRGAGRFKIEDNCAVFTIYGFSTFELSGTVTYVEPSYSSGSSYDPTYSVTVDKTKNGTVTVSPKSASKGDTVTVTVKPDSGYVLETLTVTDKNGNELTLKDKGDGKYTFTMPAGKVEVKATFMEDNSMLNFFYDVPNGAYFYEAVKWAVKNGITTGVGNDLFAPEQPCTRAQIVTFLWRAAGSPEPKGAASGMTDVVSGSYYEKAVAWAIENGITTGTTTSTFSPNVTCTRAQAVTFLARALKAKAASAAEFSDVPTGSYFADAVAWAAANGVTEGIGGGLFGSDNDCTRGQIVTFLYRAYNK